MPFIIQIVIVVAIMLLGLLVIQLRRQRREKTAYKKTEPVLHVDSDVSPKPDAAVDEASNENDLVVQEAALNTKQKGLKPEELIVVNVIARAGEVYAGYELLQALLSAGLRFGKMNIFHRHQESSGRGDILFSVASATNPGTFELSKMGGFSCSGLTLFLQFSGQKDLMKSFELMLETARQLTDDLGGEVLDQQRQPLGQRWAQDWRHKIRVYEESTMTADLFA